MMGNKKLSTIRDEIRTAMAKEHIDPIAWLDAEISAAKRQNGADLEVLESLKRVLSDVPKANERKRPVRSKK
jgi:hypothetical protein